MKHLLLLTPLLLAACVVHQDPCLRQDDPLLKEYNCVEVDRSGRSSFVVHDPSSGNTDGGDNGAGSASSDDVSDSGDSNGSVSSDNSSDKNKDRPRKVTAKKTTATIATRATNMRITIIIAALPAQGVRVPREWLDELETCLPDDIGVYRIIKASGAKKHGEIAKAVAAHLKPIRRILAALEQPVATTDAPQPDAVDLTDLTKIEKPFYLLDEATQKALRECGGPWQVVDDDGWEDVSDPGWFCGCTYRQKPQPPKPREYWIRLSRNAELEEALRRVLIAADNDSYAEYFNAIDDATATLAGKETK